MKRIYSLVLIMASVAFIIGSISIYVLHETAFEIKRQDLIQMAKSQARLIEAMARFDQEYSDVAYPAGARNATLSQFKAAIDAYKGFGDTGEFVLGDREGDEIVFLLKHRHPRISKGHEGGTYEPSPISFSSSLAEPMRRALNVESGTVIGLDYRGEPVLAAHEPVAELDLAIVAKLDISEIRAPFIRAVAIISVVGVFVVLGSVFLFFKVSNPLTNRIIKSEEQNRLLLQSAGDGIYGLDPQGKITFANPAACAVMMRSEDELKGKPISEIVHDEAREQDATENRGSIKRSDGSIIHIGYTSTPITKGRETIGTVVTFKDISQRVEVENKLSGTMAELQFQKFALDKHAIVSITDVAGEITYANEKFCTISGYSLDELIGQNHSLLRSDEHSVDFYKKLWRTIAAGDVWNGDIKNIKKAGGFYWVNATIVPFLNKQNKPFQYVAIRTDITEHKSNEESVRRQERETSLQHQIATALVETKSFEEGLQLSINMICEQTAWSVAHAYVADANDADRLNPTEIWHGADDAKIEAFKVATRKTSFTRGIGLPGRVFKSGKPAWVPDIHEDKNFPRLKEADISHLRSAFAFPVSLDGKCEAILEFFSEEQVDLDERFLHLVMIIGEQIGRVLEKMRAERAIDQFKTTLDRTQDCIFMFHADTLKFFYVNQGAMDQVKYSEKELFQMRAFDIKPDFTEGSYKETIQPIIDGPQHSSTFETNHQAKDGTIIPVEVFLQYIAPENEEPRFVAIVRDVTERRKVDKAKSEFISTISHELRTPLTSIKGSLSLIQSGVMGQMPDNARSMLDIAYNNSNRLILLINDILDMEKFETGGMAFLMKPMETSDLIAEALVANKGYAEEHKVTFVSGAIQAAKINGDKDRLVQVLSNLMSNAAKFSENGDVVTLSSTIKDDQIIISVQDNGQGIPEAFRKDIFEKFTQADASDTRQIGGTGLGLTITKAIVEEHKGIIDYTSEVGVGTTFSVALPLIKKS